MREFVRICPKCKRQNPEYENLCAGCGQFIAMEATVPKPPPEPIKKVEPPPAPQPKPNKPKPKPKPISAAPAPTQRFTPPEAAAFYLQLATGGTVFTVKHGWVLGQAHPGSPAQVQIPLEVAGSQYLHRQHCRFLRQASGWLVQALDQRRFQRDFTNPTRVNGKPVAAGASQPLRDGDVLGLSGLEFKVKILD